jgi:FKBP-type peptidyl-prolyl cis-trans isomerase
MHEGGFRKIKVAPHLAFGEAGYPEIKVPAKAVVTFQIWLRTVTKRVHDEKANQTHIVSANQ